MFRLKSIFIIGLMLLAGCGVKGNLQPEGAPEPEAPSSLSLIQQGDIVQLRWDIPTMNQDGSRLTDLAGFRVDLYTYRPGQYCPECRDQETVATISINQPDPAIISNDNVYLRRTHPAVDEGSRYRVYPYTGSGKSGPYVEARLVVKAPPPAPIKVRAEAVDRGASLLWSLPERIQQGGELLGINIYRGDSSGNFEPEPVNIKPVKGNNFDDFGLENNKRYQYGLRTVLKIDKFEVESGMSEIVAVTPKTGL